MVTVKCRNYKSTKLQIRHFILTTRICKMCIIHIAHNVSKTNSGVFQHWSTLLLKESRVKEVHGQPVWTRIKNIFQVKCCLFFYFFLATVSQYGFADTKTSQISFSLLPQGTGPFPPLIWHFCHGKKPKLFISHSWK